MRTMWALNGKIAQDLGAGVGQGVAPLGQAEGAELDEEEPAVGGQGEAGGHGRQRAAGLDGAGVQAQRGLDGARLEPGARRRRGRRRTSARRSRSR